MTTLPLATCNGFAGLLDLGYIAFYAVGAYVYALLASPHFNLHLPFWIILPALICHQAKASYAILFLYVEKNLILGFFRSRWLIHIHIRLVGLFIIK